MRPAARLLSWQPGCTGEKKKGPTIRTRVKDALMIKRREEIANKFLTNEWGVQLKGFEEGRQLERRKHEPQLDRRTAERWRR